MDSIKAAFQDLKNGTAKSKSKDVCAAVERVADAMDYIVNAPISCVHEIPSDFI